MQKECVVFGSGMVSPPVFEHLKNKQVGFAVVSDQPDRAAELVGDYPNAEIYSHDISDERAEKDIDEVMNDARVVLSLLPYVLHTRVAQACLRSGSHLVTASYVSDEMRALHEPAVDRKLLFLNECGLDPGLDHMSAMQALDAIRESGGTITSYESYCGGLPVPASADNPFKYKFSWSPKGVLSATRNPATYLSQGDRVHVPSGHLDTVIQPVHVGPHTYEGYPNRDSLNYQQLYGLDQADSILRGTLRYPGWTRTMAQFHSLGLLGDKPVATRNQRHIDMLAEILSIRADSVTYEKVQNYIRQQFPPEEAEDLLSKLRWLGLTSDEPSDFESATMSAIDVVAHQMLSRMQYQPHERDAVIMMHNIGYVDSDGKQQQHTLELYVEGNDQYTAMARTTGLTAAVVTQLVLEGRINRTGVQIPIYPDMYEPVLSEMDTLGIRFTSTTTESQE